MIETGVCAMRFSKKPLQKIEPTVWQHTYSAILIKMCKYVNSFYDLDLNPPALPRRAPEAMNIWICPRGPIGYFGRSKRPMSLEPCAAQIQNSLLNRRSLATVPGVVEVRAKPTKRVDNLPLYGCMYAVKSPDLRPRALAAAEGIPVSNRTREAAPARSIILRRSFHERDGH